MSNNICSNCNGEVSSDAIICINCGYNLKKGDFVNKSKNGLAKPILFLVAAISIVIGCFAFMNIGEAILDDFQPPFEISLKTSVRSYPSRKIRDVQIHQSAFLRQLVANLQKVENGKKLLEEPSIINEIKCSLNSRAHKIVYDRQRDLFDPGALETEITFTYKGIQVYNAAFEDKPDIKTIKTHKFDSEDTKVEKLLKNIVASGVDKFTSQKFEILAPKIVDQLCSIKEIAEVINTAPYKPSLEDVINSGNDYILKKLPEEYLDRALKLATETNNKDHNGPSINSLVWNILNTQFANNPRVDNSFIDYLNQRNSIVDDQIFQHKMSQEGSHEFMMTSFVNGKLRNKEVINYYFKRIIPYEKLMVYAYSRNKNEDFDKLYPFLNLDEFKSNLKMDERTNKGITTCLNSLTGIGQKRFFKDFFEIRQILYQKYPLANYSLQSSYKSLNWKLNSEFVKWATTQDLKNNTNLELISKWIEGALPLTDDNLNHNPETNSFRSLLSKIELEEDHFQDLKKSSSIALIKSIDLNSIAAVIDDRGSILCLGSSISPVNGHEITLNVLENSKVKRTSFTEFKVIKSNPHFNLLKIQVPLKSSQQTIPFKQAEIDKDLSIKRISLHADDEKLLTRSHFLYSPKGMNIFYSKSMLKDPSILINKDGKLLGLHSPYSYIRNRIIPINALSLEKDDLIQAKQNVNNIQLFNLRKQNRHAIPIYNSLFSYSHDIYWLAHAAQFYYEKNNDELCKKYLNLIVKNQSLPLIARLETEANKALADERKLIHQKMAKLFKEMGMDKELIVLEQALLEKNPANPHILKSSLTRMLSSNEKTKAKELIDKALQISPSDVEVINSYGRFCQKYGLYEVFKQHLIENLSKDSVNYKMLSIKYGQKPTLKTAEDLINLLRKDAKDKRILEAIADTYTLLNKPDYADYFTMCANGVNQNSELYSSVNYSSDNLFPKFYFATHAKLFSTGFSQKKLSLYLEAKSRFNSYKTVIDAILTEKKIIHKTYTGTSPSYRNKKMANSFLIVAVKQYQIYNSIPQQDTSKSYIAQLKSYYLLELISQWTNLESKTLAALKKELNPTRTPDSFTKFLRYSPKVGEYFTAFNEHNWNQYSNTTEKTETK